MNGSHVTVQADKWSWERISSLPGCVALGCADIGHATVGGKHVYITWGRNLTLEQQRWHSAHTEFQPIHLGADDGSAELILPDDLVQRLGLVMTIDD